jgi:hypothetical protein
VKGTRGRVQEKAARLLTEWSTKFRASVEKQLRGFLSRVRRAARLIGRSAPIIVAFGEPLIPLLGDS